MSTSTGSVNTGLVDVVVYPPGAVAELVELVAELIDPVAELVDPVAELVEPVAEPVELVAELVDPVAELVEPVAEPVELVAEPIDPVAELVEALPSFARVRSSFSQPSRVLPIMQRDLFCYYSVMKILNYSFYLTGQPGKWIVICAVT